MVKIKKLGHLGIFVKDVEKSKKFYTEILGFKVSDVNEQGITFLRCATDHHDTVLVPLPKEKHGSTSTERREVQQISYEVDREEDLREALKFLKEKGVTIASGLRQRGPGSDMTIDFLDPDGNNIQLYCGMDQIGWDDVSKPKEMWVRKELE
ncbi:MAG: VOC family protein [Deltaproteobacteria bacterium]|nr:VOC family protein [Deltaproteobacteria bacterium]MCZ6548165.1 VOC family protein [Deltaproteobacteria bacterium]MCZ6562526.1 VOC family protein [Deltaproteobacteria bacterium]MCZ6908028.1 VOC family protein [Deltaproteobacteria bacterium]